MKNNKKKRNPHQNLAEWGIQQVWNFANKLTFLEDDLLRNITFNGKQPSMKDRLQLKTTFFWKTPFDERQPLMDDNLKWKTTFDET